MPLLLPTSSFKTTATVVIAGVSSIATAMILTVPSVSHFVVSCFPIIYDNTVFLLKPPYLYLVINSIIVCIIATSKLTHKSSSVDDSEISEVVTPIPIPVPVHLPSDIDSGYLNVVHVVSDYTGFVEKIDDVSINPTVEAIRKFPEVQEAEKSKESSDSPEPETEKPKLKNDSPEISILKHSTRKPPRFNQQKSLKSNSEGKII
jgi:hypothetical protein